MTFDLNGKAGCARAGGRESQIEGTANAKTLRCRAHLMKILPGAFCKNP